MAPAKGSFSGQRKSRPQEIRRSLLEAGTRHKDFVKNFG